MSKTPKQLADAVEKSIPEIEKAIQGYSVLIVSDVEGSMKSRIFNNGEDDKKGKIGKYKNGKYKKKREAAGLQTSYVDAQYTGELNRDIQKGVKGGKMVVGFKTEEQAKIAGHLEKKYDKVIFAPSDSEIKDAVKTGENFMINKLTEIIQGWS